MIGVCGVIGYTGTTSGLIWRIACATASPPVSSCRSSVLIGHHLDRVHGADLRADLAALAVALVEADERRSYEDDRRVGTIEPAEEAVHAGVHVGPRLQAGAPASRLGLDGVVANDGAADRKRAPGLQVRHAYPSSTASRSSCARTFLPSRRTAASATFWAGVPASAATAPASVTFTFPVAGTQTTWTCCSSGGA